MAKLSFYTSLAEKLPGFNQGEPVSYYKIDDASQFTAWYDLMKKTVKDEGPYCNFFRGVTEARYKLYNAAQRYWIRNNLMQVESLAKPLPYMEMIQNMVDKAKEVKLLQQVFAYYDLTKDQQDLPMLSILQHYNAPTPLMDWTYDLDIALYFSIDGLVKSEVDNVIEDYISVYRINKNTHSSFMIDNLNYASANIFPSVRLLAGWLQPGQVVYISDFEIKGEYDKYNRLIKPLTTYYNLNILAQKGLFVFNPDERKPLEEFPVPGPDREADNRIFCYNINKDLAELIRYRIGKEDINERFIYPELKGYAQNILTDYLKYVIE
jgi:FRG domain-containing protein